MLIDVCVASAFSKNNMGGNRAGVVLQCPVLSKEEKTKIAYQLGYSETAFLSQSERADYSLEYFTPAGEVPLCGHATIASFVVLNHLNRLKKSGYTIETRSGILSINVEDDGAIFMQQNTPQFYEILNRAEVEPCFGLKAGSGIGNLPVQMVSTGLKDIIVPIESPTVLENMVPDFAVIAKLSQERDCVGIHAFSLTGEGNLTAICRNFAPLYGIDEESATGTSNCALACYLHKYEQKRSRYIFEQGHCLNRISEIYVHVHSSGNTVSGVFAGGYGNVETMKTIIMD